MVNARSRRGQLLFDAACAGLQARGFEITASHAVRRPRDLGKVLARLIADGHDLIAVGGGDGTLAGAAGKLARKPIVMAILPLGTANSFARTLGIAPELEPALDVIADGDLARADVVRIGDGYFINSATIGVPGQIAEDIPSGLKKWFGRIGYLAYGCYKFLTMQAFEATISVAGQADVVEQVVEIRIGNGPFVGGLRVIDGPIPKAATSLSSWCAAVMRRRWRASGRPIWQAGRRQRAGFGSCARRIWHSPARRNSRFRSMARPVCARRCGSRSSRQRST